MKERTIFHIDVNAAYLSWEAAYRINILGETQDLREIPAVIGGDMSKRRGIVLAKSIPAKKYQIQTGEPLTAALSKCPQLMVVPSNYALYESCSKAFINILRDYTPIVEQYSIDEAFMDMTGTEGLYGSEIGIAYVIKDRIYRELGFSVNVGISSNKLLAKMASDFTKPNRVHTLYPNEIEQKMWPLGIRELFYVGKASEEKLKRLGIHTIGQLAQADPWLLKSHLNKQGVLISQYAKGIDLAPVIAQKTANKGYGNSMTIPFDIDSIEEAKKILLSLCETLGRRLRADDAQANCMSVSIVNTYFEQCSHQKMLTSPTHTTHELYGHACLAFDELWCKKVPIRQLGVHTSKISYGEGYQYNFFDMNKNDKYAKLDQAIDAIRSKYGNDVIKRSTFIDSKLDHMAGGITRDKQSGITKC